MGAKFKILLLFFQLLLIYSSIHCKSESDEIVAESRQDQHSNRQHNNVNKPAQRQNRQLFGNRQQQQQISPNNRPPMFGQNNRNNSPNSGYFNSNRQNSVIHSTPPQYNNNRANNGNQANIDNNIGNNNNNNSPVNFDSSDESNDVGTQNWPMVGANNNDQPRIVHLDVKCEKNLMKVNLEFDKPFNGLIFSKGHYNYRNCVYLPPNTGRKNVYFDISINSCGTTGNANGAYLNDEAAQENGMFFENIVVVQYDPQVQEAWDQARKLRCTWHDQYEKAVSFRPFPVDMLDVVRADFAGDNVGCWMQIQVGKGPWASEVAGIVKIGQTMTMVLAIKDEENKFDMLVRNCVAHDSKRQPIELVDSNGCIQRPKLMSKFTKIKNFGSSASVLSYAHFKAFKFPDSMEVHFQCTIQICRFQCPDQCSLNSGDSMLYHNGDQTDGEIRKKRDVFERVISGTLRAPTAKNVGLDKIIKVVSPRDLSFELDDEAEGANNTVTDNDALVSRAELTPRNAICIPKFGFVVGILSITVMIVLCTMTTFMLSRRLAQRSNCSHAEKQQRKHLKAVRSFPNHNVPYLYDDSN